MPPVEMITAWVMLIALVIYVLLGGADFGGGVWDLFAAGPRGERQREFITEAIGPIWEANHVWLIVVIVVMFSCFPRAFAGMSVALHVPLTLVLIGIVARGSSFTFRSYGDPSRAARRRWGWVFSIASVLTPVLLGVSLGATATGEIRWDEQGVYRTGFFRPWLDPFAWSVGFFTLAIFAYLAAVYLCAEAEETDLREDFRRRALASGLAVILMAGLTWILAFRYAGMVSRDLAQSWWTLPLQLATAAAAIGAIAGLWRRRFFIARFLAVVQVILMVVGYGAAKFPYLIVPDITIQNSAAPPQMHWLILGALAIGCIILLPSLWYLFRVFKGPTAFRLLDWR